MSICEHLWISVIYVALCGLAEQDLAEIVLPSAEHSHIRGIYPVSIFYCTLATIIYNVFLILICIVGMRNHAKSIHPSLMGKNDISADLDYLCSLEMFTTTGLPQRPNWSLPCHRQQWNAVRCRCSVTMRAAVLCFSRAGCLAICSVGCASTELSHADARLQLILYYVKCNLIVNLSMQHLLLYVQCPPIFRAS